MAVVIGRSTDTLDARFLEESRLADASGSTEKLHYVIDLTPRERFDADEREHFAQMYVGLCNLNDPGSQ
jgi:hypothetical protein